MNNYSFYTEKHEDGLFTLVLKCNDDIINIIVFFKSEESAALYADSYIRGFKDARGEA